MKTFPPNPIPGSHRDLVVPLVRRAALLLGVSLTTLPCWGALTVNADGTVTDSTTKLMWDQCTYGLSGADCTSGAASTFTWMDALAVVKAANAAKYKGFSDWHLPNKNELESITRIRSVPIIDATYFPGTPADSFWTSTNFKSPSSAWFVNFFDNSVAYQLKTNRFRVRLVRDLPGVAIPAAPTIGSATAGDKSATVTFAAPGNPGGAPIDQYRATCTDKTATGTASPITVTGLTNGTSYTCTVAAHNSGGWSPESAASNTVVPASVPSCTLTATPVVIASGGSATLKVSCTPAASSYAWSVTDLSKNTTTTPTLALTNDSVTVNPAVPTQYSVVGKNDKGEGPAAKTGVYVCNTPPYQDYSGLVFTGDATPQKISDTVGNDVINGDSGIDMVLYNCNRANFFVNKTATGWIVSSLAEGADTLTNIERLQFADKTLALDITGNAGQAYRLYQAAFNRTPDGGGLKYWIEQMDTGTTLEQVAVGFINSAEFKALYGENPSNEDFVTKLYSNVLHRAPDAGGKAYWVEQLNKGTSKAAVLASFSESPENQAGVLNAIMYGIDLPK